MTKTLLTIAFVFKFAAYKGDSYIYTIAASDPIQAYREAAEDCFNHYKRNLRLSMDEGQDIIDICANPIQIKQISQ